MKIVVAPDSFKGSLTSIQVAEIINQAILSIYPDAEVIQKPMADGGEGTLEALLSASNGKRIPIECTGPLGKKIQAEYAIIEGHTAIIECAKVAGLIQVPVKERNPDNTTSYGIGEVIQDALNKNCTNIIIGLGGSAINDGGLGMLQALGMEALNQNGDKVGPYGRNLLEITAVNFSRLDQRLKSVSLNVASDVDNPLCGERGATYVYGTQKGATPKQLQQYDASIKQYGMLVETAVGKSIMNHPGAGAAGGLGFALLSLGADLVSGAELLAEAMALEGAIQDANLIITGEGQSDEQTLYGKAPGYIASLAQKHNVPVILLSGSLSGDLDVLRERFSGCFSIINKPLSLNECMVNADKLLYEQAKQVMHLIKSIKLS